MNTKWVSTLEKLLFNLFFSAMVMRAGRCWKSCELSWSGATKNKITSAYCRCSFSITITSVSPKYSFSSLFFFLRNFHLHYETQIQNNHETTEKTSGKKLSENISFGRQWNSPCARDNVFDAPRIIGEMAKKKRASSQSFPLSLFLSPYLSLCLSKRW